MAEPEDPQKVSQSELIYSFPKKEGNYHVSSIKYSDGKEFRLISSFLNLVEIEDSIIVIGIRASKDARVTKFYNDLVRAEENTVKTMAKSSESWFRKSIPLHKLEGMFRSCISRTSDLGQNIFRFKLSKKLKIFNESEENIITLDELKVIDKSTFRLQCNCLIDSLIIGRDAAKLDIKVTQIRIKKNPPPKPVETPVQPTLVQPNDSDDEIDYDTFDCADSPPVEQPTIPSDEASQPETNLSACAPAEEETSPSDDTKIIKLSVETKGTVAENSVNNQPNLKNEETMLRISDLKKQLRQAADEDNDERVTELSLEIRELKKLLI